MFRYELHMHSREASACARSSIHDMIRRYAQLGFSGAVLTNHFIGGNTAIDRSLPWKALVRAYAQPYYDGVETARALNFDLLFGVEQGYGKGKEFLVYGVEPEYLAARPRLRNAGPEEWAEAVHEAGGFFAYAHPFRQRDYITDPGEIPDMTFADGVEVFNRCNLPGDNAEALRVFGKSGTILIAGSDTHDTGFDDPWAVEFSHRVSTGPELATALRENSFRLWLGTEYYTGL